MLKPKAMENQRKKDSATCNNEKNSQSRICQKVSDMQLKERNRIVRRGKAKCNLKTSEADLL